ncbi:MAG TPA: peptidylprolyl isomerase [Noviherbaspirillum sp.]|nr:peptidylprolyl isomerase [Noviherbaspirillum sp.]
MNITPISRLVRFAPHSIAVAMAVLCAGTLVALPAAAQASGAPRVQLADAIVAVVNNEAITRVELEQRMRRVERTMQAQGIGLPPVDQFERQVLESMILDRAQLQLAREMGIRVDDAMLDRAISRIAEQNGMSIAAFRTQLEREGLSFARFREEIREEIAMQRVREREVDNKIQIPESEVDNFLAAEAQAVQAEQEYSISHILVRIPENASAEQIAERQQRAEDVMRQVQGGSDFARLAATYSDAPDALSGGDLGWRTRDRLPQIFLDAVDPLQPGQVSRPLRSANGFHILKLNERRSAQEGDALSGAVTQTRARHILIRVNQVTSAAEARRRLAELKQRLDNGAATFEELARTFSGDGSAAKGGDLGWLYPGDTVPEFERAMNALEPGQISEPVESPFGFHLIQVVERKQDDVSEGRKRGMARLIIRDRKLEEATADWLRQLRDRTYVEYRLDESRY